MRASASEILEWISNQYSVTIEHPMYGRGDYFVSWRKYANREDLVGGAVHADLVEALREAVEKSE
jgi:hypothetical protein